KAGHQPARVLAVGRVPAPPQLMPQLAAGTQVACHSPRREAMTQMQRTATGGLKVAKALFDFLAREVLPGTGVHADRFWGGLAALVHELAPRNRALLARRDELQAKIDTWHEARRGQSHDAMAYETFLREIGYLVPEGPDFKVDTANVDPEIAAIAG